MAICSTNYRGILRLKGEQRTYSNGIEGLSNI